MAEKQWRPPNWAEIKADLEGSFMDITTMDEIDIGIEAVADAILEALRDARFPYTGGQFAGIDITKEGDFLIILKS